MALQKSFTYKGEVKAESYWRILTVEVVNGHAPYAEVVIAGYSSKQTRDAGVVSNIISQMKMLFPGDHVDRTWSDFYGLIKLYKVGDPPEDGEEDTREQPFSEAVDI